MIRLPSTPLPGRTQIANPEMNPRAAAAPAIALGQTAQAIAGISDQFHAVAIDTQRKENARRASEIRTDLAQKYAEFDLELQKDPDPASRIAKTKQFLGDYQTRLDADDLPPELAANLRTHFDEFASNAVIRRGAEAAELEQKRAALALRNELEVAIENNDIPSARKAFDTGVAGGIYLPEEWSQLERRIKKKQEQDLATREVYADPRAWLDKNAQPPASGDLGDWQRNRELARTLYHRSVTESGDQFLDLLYGGKITDEAQIEQAFGDQRPAVLAEMKAKFFKLRDEQEKTALKSPEVQNRIIGQVSAAMDSYDPDLNGADTEYVRIAGLIRDVSNPDMQAELRKQLDAVRDGAEQEVKTHADEAFKSLADAYKSGRFGNTEAKPDVPKMTLQRAISDGLLDDKKKLSAFFPQEIVDNIAEGKLNVNGDKPKNPLTQNERAAVFRAELGKLSPAKQEAALASLSRMDRALFEAIRDRKGFSTEVEGDPSPEAEDAAISAKLTAEENYGRAKLKLTEFLKVNPKATPTEINDKILEIAGEEARRKLSGGFFDPKPTRSGGPKGADDSTSMVPMGNDLKAVVKHFEAGGAPGGFHRAAYWDYGQWSIGYGTKAKQGEVIDQAEAERRLDSELSSHRERVVKEAERIGLKLEPHEIDALTSFDYNTGRISQLLADGTRTKAEIADKMLLYRNADGQRLRGLERRRQAERTLFLNGYTS